MNDIYDLYQDIILHHSASPKNFGSLKNHSHDALGHNTSCGDIINLSVLVSEDIIVDIAFSGDGCAISKASASLMTESIKGKTVNVALELFNSFHTMLLHDSSVSDMGKLEALKGVRQFPMRVKCATLCWHTLSAALLKEAASVTTE